jgi:hypothetical protein
VNAKKIVLIGTFACVFLLLLALILGRYSRPATAAATTVASPWNTHAIEGALAGVRVQEVDSGHAAVVFLYDLDNRTSTDYRLAKGPNVVIMSRLKTSDSLSADDPADIESGAFLPAGNRARVAIEVVQPFAWPNQKDAAADRNFRDLVAGRVAGLRGFVLFDQAARYQIELPAELAGLQQSSAAVGP